MSQKWKTKRCVKLVTALVGAAALTLVLAGCDDHDWENPEYVAQLLEDGTDSQRLMAVDRLNDFDEEHRPMLAAAATKAYLEVPELRSDIMRRLIEWRSAEAADAYLEELDGNHAGYARAAGEALGQAGVTDAVPRMVEIFDQTQDTERQIGIMRGLSHIPEPEAVGQVAAVLSNHDVDNYPISLHRAACGFMGGLAMQQPDALTDEAIAGVVSARFLGDERGRDTAAECGMAIQQLGPKAIPHLVELFNQENEAVSRILRNYDDPGSGEHFPQNMAKQRAAQHLTQLRAPEAVELFSEGLRHTVETPDYDQERLLPWASRESGAINEMIRGLGYIGSPEATEVLQEVVDPEVFDEDGRWHQIASPGLQIMALQDSARALNRIGDREALAVLIELAQGRINEEALQHQQAIKAVAEERDDVNAPPPFTERFRPERIAAKSYAYLGGADDREAYEEWADEVEKLFAEFEHPETEDEEQPEPGLDDDGFVEKVRGYAVAFDVMDECEGEEDEADRASCFAGFLDHDDEHARAKAAFELSRLPVEASGSLVTENLGTSNLDTREILVSVAAYRVATPEMVEAVDEVLNAESMRSSSEFEASHQHLKLLQAWLAHNVE